MLKKPMILATSLLISSSALALEPAFSFDMPENFDTDWYVGHVLSKPNWHTATFRPRAKANIGNSRSGSKSIFFSFYPKNYSLECSEETKHDRKENIIFYVDGQPIKGIWYCQKYIDTKEAYYTFNGATEAGRGFIVNAFKKSEYVTVKAKGEKYTFSADGFTAAWNDRANAL